MEGNASLAEIVLPIAKWGIDVRSYAQKAKTSCALLALRYLFVAVCPRGVQIENDTPAGHQFK
jgi:hypothetical protein